MDVIDKHNILESIKGSEYIELELGCGNRKRVASAIGIDSLDYECVDIVGDVLEVLKRFPSSSVDAVYSYHFFEHIANISILMDELERVLKQEGSLEVVVPHFSNPYFYSDYTHKSFFGLYTFSYFSSNVLFQREVPTYQRKSKWELQKVDLIFKSSRPFYFRHVIKLLLGKILNINNYTKEFYEENLCYIFPCYEIKYSLKKLGDL